jgi:hypothetical protein
MVPFIHNVSAACSEASSITCPEEVVKCTRVRSGSVYMLPTCSGSSTRFISSNKQMPIPITANAAAGAQNRNHRRRKRRRPALCRRSRNSSRHCSNSGCSNPDVRRTFIRSYIFTWAGDSDNQRSNCSCSASDSLPARLLSIISHSIFIISIIGEIFPRFIMKTKKDEIGYNFFTVFSKKSVFFFRNS